MSLISSLLATPTESSIAATLLSRFARLAGVALMLAMSSDSFSAEPKSADTAKEFTLSTKGIMSLDDTKAEKFYFPPFTATVKARRERADGGVELDIHFPGTKSRDYTLQLTSNQWAGSTTPAGLDLSTWDKYALKFTILAADGSTTSCPTLTVGALVGPTADGKGFAFKPVRLALPAQASGVSSTGGFATKPSVLGMTISLFGGKWPEGPHDVTMLVERVAGATAVAPEPKPAATAREFTLSNKGIMALDDTTAFFSPPLTATVKARRERPDGGVELDIHFPSTKSPDYNLQLTSNSRVGAHTLVGLDVGEWEIFALKFTILSADGSTTTCPTMTVGALIGPTAKNTHYGYQPVRLALPAKPSGVSSTGGFAPKSSVIGMTISLYGGQWSEGPHDVTMLVEPVEGATPLPK